MFFINTGQSFQDIFCNFKKHERLLTPFFSSYLSMSQVVEDRAEVLGIPVYEKGTALVLKSKLAAA
jgi:hypothetical protein